MNLRLITIFVFASEKAKIEQILKDHSINELWHDSIGDKKVITRALVPAQSSEKILDSLEENFGGKEGFRVIILPVEGSVPRLEEKDSNEKVSRISREELYTGITKNVEFNWVYVALVIFSVLVASAGVIYENVPMIVGSMVIAPFLGPSVAFSFATILGDLRLLAKSLFILFVGVLIALAFSSLMGTVFPFEISSEIKMRTDVHLFDVIVSLVSGSVGVLSYTTATLTSLAGVMVAVALLPPLVVTGLLIGIGEFSLATGAFFLFLVNLIGINLAGVITFLFQKIHPRTFMEKEKARLITLLAIILLLTILAFTIIVVFI